MVCMMIAAMFGLLIATVAGAADVMLVKPSAADPAITQYDDPNVVIGGRRDAPLAIFLPGTGGKPGNTLPLLKTIAEQGYRVIGLSYDDEPAVQQICPRTSDPDCARAFREMRIYGTGRAVVANPPAEAIEARLVALLRYLAARSPGDGWAGYLAADGKPAWSRILVSGLSQGAGMAAFIAKRSEVYRVVLFSSPWDTAGPQRDGVLAPWLKTPSATPMDRWWAERHVREGTTDLLARAYPALGIAADHVLLFDKGLPANVRPDAANPYHGSTVRLIDYAPQWRILYGAAK